MGHLYLFFIFLATLSCTHQPTPQFITSPAVSHQSLEAGVMQKVAGKVYQVLIPRPNDQQVTYDRPLPLELLPYEERTSNFISIGSAFSLEPGKYLSCAHVFALHELPFHQDYYLKAPDGAVHRIEKILRWEQDRDVIEFQLEDTLALETLGPQTQFSLGEPVYSVGNALGQGISIRAGVISSITMESEFGEWEMLRFSAAASPGNSGGPLVNAQGQVLGIIQAKSQNENLNLALPIGELEKVSKIQTKIRQRQYFIVNQEKIYLTQQLKTPLPGNIGSVRKQLFEALREGSEQLAMKELKQQQPSKEQREQMLADLIPHQSHSFWTKPLREHSGRWSLWEPTTQRQEFPNGNILEMAINERPMISVFDGHLLFVQQQDHAASWSLQHREQVIQSLLTLLRPFYFQGISLDITKMPPAQHSQWMTDRHGRAWVFDLWRFKDFYHTLLTFCTPMPQGIACHWYGPADHSLEAYGGYQLMVNELNDWGFSPKGTAAQWQDYFALPAAKRWSQLGASSTVAFDEKKRLLSFQLADWKGSLTLPAAMDRPYLQGSLLLTEKKSKDLQWTWGIGGITLEGPFSEFANSYHLYPAPSKKASLERRALYQKAKERKGNFALDQVQKNDRAQFYQIIKPHPSSPEVLEQIFCYQDLSQSPETLKKWCQNFSTAVSYAGPITAEKSDSSEFIGN